MKARRKPLTFLLAATLLGALFTAYLHFGVLPGDLRDYAIRKIETLTGKRVSFDKTLFLPFHGLSFYNLKVTDRMDVVLFSTKKLRLDAELMTFFREKKIVINHAYLEEPFFTATLGPVKPKTQAPPVMTKISGQIAVPVLPEDTPALDTLEGGPDALLPENVYLEKVEILNGRFLVRNADGAPLEDLRDIHVTMRFQSPPVLQFDGSLKLGTRPYAHLRLQGFWNLETSSYEFRFRSKSAIVPEWLARYQSKNFVALKKGRSTLDVRLKSAGGDEAIFHAEADLAEAELAARGGETYSGQMTLSADGVFDFYQRNLTRYKGALDFVDVRVSGLPASMPPPENLSGALHFQPDLLEIRALRGQYKNLVFEADGTVRSFQTLDLDARVRMNAPLGNLLPFLPAEDRAKLEGLVVEGQCETATSLSGSLKDLANLKTRHTLGLQNGTVRDANGKWEATAVTGNLFSDDQGFRIREARFTSGGKRYTLDAFVPKDAGAVGSVHLRSDDLALSSDYVRSENEYSLKDARLLWRGIAADFEGTVLTGARAMLDLRGQASVDLFSARELITERLPGLKDAGLKGTLAGKFLLKGGLDDPAGWDFQMDAAGSPVFYKEKLRLEDFEVQIRFKNRLLNLPYFHARTCGGVVGGHALFDFTRTDAAFNTKLYANALDLRQAGPAFGLAQKDFYGTLLFDATLEGPLKDKRGWRGAGSIDVRDGHLWKTSIFKKMGDLPFVKVLGLDEVVFTGGRANFTVRDAKVWSDNLRLNSETVALALRGSVSFEGNLDFVMNIAYTDNVITGALDTGGIVPFVIEQAGGMISQYRISGTLKAPKTEKILLAGAANAVTKGVTDVVQSITR